jgi:hypothetical protein
MYGIVTAALSAVVATAAFTSLSAEAVPNIWKVIAGKTLSRKAVTDLLKKGETAVLRGFISKSGKKFPGKLRLEGADFRTTFVTTTNGAS